MTVFNRWATGPGARAAFLQAIPLPSLLWCGVMAFYVTIEVASRADVLPRRLTGELTTILQAFIILSVTITLAGMVETLITRVGESRALRRPRDRPGVRGEPADHSRRRFSRPALGARDPNRAHPDGARRWRARRRARAAGHAVEPVRRDAPAGRSPDSRGRLREDRRLRGGLRRRRRLAVDAGEEPARQRGRGSEQARARIDHHQLRPAAVAPRAWDPRERRLRQRSRPGGSRAGGRGDAGGGPARAAQAHPAPLAGRGHRDALPDPDQSSFAGRVAAQVMRGRSRTVASTASATSMRPANPIQGPRQLPTRSTPHPKIGGPSVTPREETASPSPTAVPAERAPASSAISVCWTPFQPMPQKPKTSAINASVSAPVLGPIIAPATQQSADPIPASASGMRRRPPNVRSESTPKAMRPAIPAIWAR